MGIRGFVRNPVLSLGKGESEECSVAEDPDCQVILDTKMYLRAQIYLPLSAITRWEGICHTVSELRRLLPAQDMGVMATGGQRFGPFGAWPARQGPAKAITLPGITFRVS